MLLPLGIIFAFATKIDTLSTCESGGGRCLDINHYTCNEAFTVGHCPGPSHIRCCYDSPCKDQEGVCLNINQVECSIPFTSNLCWGPSHIKCCLVPTCAQAQGECKDAGRTTCDSAFRTGMCPGARYMQCCIPGNGCSFESKQRACEVLDAHSVITLATSHPSGVADEAYASLNVQDVCNGTQAKRSAYSATCSASPAPGGQTCLSENILQYILYISELQLPFKVNELAGACHSTHSYHYEGRGVDIDAPAGTPQQTIQTWKQLCTSMGGTAFGPPDAGHQYHVHCQI